MWKYLHSYADHIQSQKLTSSISSTLDHIQLSRLTQSVTVTGLQIKYFVILIFQLGAVICKIVSFFAKIAVDKVRDLTRAI